MKAGAAAYVAAKLRSLDADLEPAAKRVLAAADDEAVHDMRVAIRRTRTLLKIARPLFGTFHTDAVRRAFVAVQKATGELRDEEALEETLAKIAIKDAPFNAWRERRKARERMLRRAVVRMLASGELTRARELLLALVTLPTKPSRDRDAAKFARKSAEEAREGIEKHRDAKTDDVEALHELRIAYKQLRYAIELFTDVLPADVIAARDPAVRFQKKLGEIHDLDVAALTITRARGLLPHTKELAVRALVTERARKIESYTREMQPAPPPAPTTPAEPIRASAASRSGKSRPSSRRRAPSDGPAPR
ncbi:MAG: CHAD domain-containing protein [Polyangiaceae bacterium]